MPTLEEVRKKYPQYGDMTDEQLISGMHSKYYSDMPKSEFLAKLGVTALPEPNIAHKGDMKPDGAIQQRDGFKFDPKVTAASAIGEGVTQGVTIGAADEGVAAINATSKTNALGAGDLPAWQDRYDQNKARLDAERAAQQEAHPIISAASELAGGLAVPGLGTAKFIKGGIKLAKDAPKIAKIAKLAGQTARSSAVGAGYGGTYGYNSGIGGFDSPDRFSKAKSGAKAGAVVGAVLPPTGAAIKAAVSGAKNLNKLSVIYPDAASEVSSDILALEKQGMKPRDVSENGPDGAKALVKKLQIDIKEEMKPLIQSHKAELYPKDFRTPKHQALVELAQRGLRNLETDVKGYTTPEEINAINDLVGHTRQGKRLVLLAKKKVEVKRIDMRGVKGGFSARTDELSPFGAPARFNGASRNAFRTVGSIINGVTFGLPGLLAQGAGLTVGRAIDAATGRRALVNLFKQQNLGKVTSEAVDHLPSQYDILRRSKAQADAIKEADRQASKMDTIRRKAEGDNVSFDKRKAQAVQKEINQSEKRLTAAHAKADTENKKFDAQVARAQKIAQQETERQSKAAAKAAEEAPQQAFAARVKMLANARKGVEAMTKQAKAAAKPEMKAAKVKPAYTGRTDASGAPIKSEYNYEARKTEILGLEQTAKQKAAKHPAEIRKAIEEAVDNMHNHGRGRKKQTERIHFYTEALAKAKTPEDVAAITDALKPLVDVFGK